MHLTEICKGTLEPKWNSHYDLYLERDDVIKVSVWNNKKIHKKEGSGGFLGCVKIANPTIQRLKDTGCELYNI